MIHLGKWLPKPKSNRSPSKLSVNPFQKVIRSIIWANKWICQESYVQPQSGYQQNALRDHIKKRMTRAVDSVGTTQNRTLRDHPKRCPNDRNNIAGLRTPDIQSNNHRFMRILKAYAHENQSHVGQSVNHALWLNPALRLIWRANGYLLQRVRNSHSRSHMTPAEHSHPSRLS